MEAALLGTSGRIGLALPRVNDLLRREAGYLPRDYRLSLVGLVGPRAVVSGLQPTGPSEAQGRPSVRRLDGLPARAGGGAVELGSRTAQAGTTRARNAATASWIPTVVLPAPPFWLMIAMVCTFSRLRC